RDGDSRGFRDRDDRAGSGRPSRDGDSRGAGRPSSGRPSTGRPARDGDSRGFRDRDDRGGAGRPRRDDARGFRDRDDRDDRSARSRRPSGDAPIIADHITGEELPRAVRNELRTLPDGLALRVARHMAACVELANVDPELAWQHAKAALDKASRIAVVRETAAGAAYNAGHFAEALSEYRAAKRMTGNKEYWPVMADCERALGRPGKAISMASDPIVAGLSIGGRVEMRIVVSGARLDQGNKEAALATLQCPELNKPATEPWAARIRYAYADILASMDQTQEAIEWFHRAAAVDLEEQTDSDRRIAQLEGNVYEEFDNDFVYEEYADDEDE
ncbi:MAG: tetratricopeptide repeat protein, partial [Actinomycetes bacterium]